MADKRKIRYFFLNGGLHKVIKITRSQDRIEAFDYSDGKPKAYLYSDAKRNMQNAYNMREVAEVFNKSRFYLHGMIFTRGEIAGINPQRVYDMKTGEHRLIDPWFFSEDDMMTMRDHLAGIHRGQPRKDGKITNNTTPTREEMRQWLDHGRMVYVKEGDKFIPIWRADDW